MPRWSPGAKVELTELQRDLLSIRWLGTLAWMDYHLKHKMAGVGFGRRCSRRPRDRSHGFHDVELKPA
jgi:hypothetical protein